MYLSIDEWSHFVDNNKMTDVCQEDITRVEGYIWILLGRNLIHQAKLRGFLQSLTDVTFLTFDLVYNMRNFKEISKSVTSNDGFKPTTKLLNFRDSIQSDVVEYTGFEDSLQSIENAFKYMRSITKDRVLFVIGHYSLDGVDEYKAVLDCIRQTGETEIEDYFTHIFQTTIWDKTLRT